MNKTELKSVCQIRTETGLPCERCKFNDVCTKYKKENKENGKKKQRRKGSTGRKEKCGI